MSLLLDVKLNHRKGEGNRGIEQCMKLMSSQEELLQLKKELREEGARKLAKKQEKGQDKPLYQKRSKTFSCTVRDLP